MKGAPNPKVEVFNRDVASHSGYRYTTNSQLSSRLATQRLLEIMLQVGHLAGRSVLDLGCGDGHFTIRFWDRAQARAMVGVDAAHRAIGVAQANRQSRPLRFLVGDAHNLPFRDDAFDIVLVQGVLHHDEHPADIVREALRLGRDVLILEPNGYNLGLKVIERTSTYHREHEERSYMPHRVSRWVEQAGGRVVRRAFAGLVPMFCPDWIARLLKRVEPVVERLPLLRTLGCAVCVLMATRRQ